MSDIELMLKNGNKSTKMEIEGRQINITMKILKQRFDAITSIALSYPNEFWARPDYFSKETHEKDENDENEKINHVARILLNHNYNNEAEEYAALYTEIEQLKKRESKFIEKYKRETGHVLKRFVEERQNLILDAIYGES